MVAGEDSPFAEHLDWHPDIWDPLQTPLNNRPSPATQDDLLAPGIA